MGGEAAGRGVESAGRRPRSSRDRWCSPDKDTGRCHCRGGAIVGKALYGIPDDLQGNAW